MFKKVLLHVSKSVFKKKEEFERKATQVFADVYRKHVFRKILANRIRVRQSIINFLYRFRFIMKLRKLYTGYTITMDIFEKAFAIAQENQKERSVRTVQRIFRGFSARDKKMPVVLNAIKAKENLKLHVAAKAIQKRLRGYIVRMRMMVLNKAA